MHFLIRNLAYPRCLAGIQCSTHCVTLILVCLFWWTPPDNFIEIQVNISTSISIEEAGEDASLHSGYRFSY